MQNAAISLAERLVPSYRTIRVQLLLVFYEMATYIVYEESDVYFIIQVSDETLLAKLNEHCVQHPHFESRASKKFLSDLTLPHGSFRLKHYAGSVRIEEQAPKCFFSRNAWSISTQNYLGCVGHANSLVFRFKFPLGAYC